jgi:CheY-like chemotaxis protein
MCRRRGGLVIVSGPAGSGKTTTVAAMVDRLNREGRARVFTIEDPVEFLHASRGGLVRQIEVGTDAPSFAGAVRTAARAGADAILVGRLDDAETAEAVLEAAGSGQLVLVEFAASSAEDTVERVLGMFPPARRASARRLLASALRGVLVQKLLPRKGGGRVAAFEVLVSTPAVAKSIRDTGARGLPEAIRSGERSGMKLLDDSLMELVAAGAIDHEAACRSASTDEFRRRCEAAGIPKDDDGVSPETAGEEREGPEFLARPVTTRRLNRAEMFLAGQAPGECRTRPGSRTAAFSNVGERSGGSAPDEGQKPPPADPRLVAGRNILVVDDDGAMRDLLEKILRGAGARVRTVAEATEAIEEIGSKTYDVAMFDILMPEVSGVELYDRAVDASPALRDRIVFVTGCNVNGKLAERIAARGAKLVGKPFEAEEIVAAAASLISGGRDAARNA